MFSTREPSSARSIRLLFWPGALLIAAVVVPFRLRPPRPGIDPSWHHALHYASAHGWQFGSDIVFTFGPLGFAHTRMYWPGLLPFTLVFWLAIAVAIAWSARAILEARGAGFASWWPAFVATLVFAAGTFVDSLVFAFLLLVFWDACAARASVARAAFLAAVAGVVALSKLSYVVMGALAVGAAVAMLLSRGARREALASAAGLAAGFVGAWVASGQDLAGLPAFAARGWEVLRGYDEAMVVRGPSHEIWAYLALALALLAPLFASAWRGRDRALAIAALATAAFLLLAFKQGFIRHDGHAIFAFVSVMPAAIVVAMARAPRGAAGALYTAAIVLAAFGLAMNAIHHHRRQPVAETWRLVVLDLGRIPAAALDFATGANEARRRHEAGLDELRRMMPLPSLVGSVDLYSHSQIALFAGGVTRWQPRPVFQSYAAYTPGLARLNAGHLGGPRAADHLLVAIEPIDGKLAALEDGASWVEMLRRYRLRETGYWAVLDRQPEASPVRRGASVVLRGRGWVELPPQATRLRLASFALERDAWDRLRRALALPERHFIELRVGPDLELRRYKFVPGAAQEPIVLSPLIASTAEFAALFAPCAAASRDEVRGVRIVDEDGGAVAFTLTVEPLDVGAAPAGAGC